jgi:hypothetical protein
MAYNGVMFTLILTFRNTTTLRILEAALQSNMAEHSINLLLETGENLQFTLSYRTWKRLLK